MSTPFHLQLPRRLYEAMVAQASAELPNECCGVLAAKTPATPVTMPIVIEQVYPLINAARSPVEYLSDDESMFAAIRDMRKHGREIVAVYHSHPTSDPIPSRKDLERNYSELVVNFIISLKVGKPEMRGWWLADNAYREAEWELID